MAYPSWAWPCPQLNASVLRGCLLPRVGRTDVQWSQIRFNGSEPRVVGSSWGSFPSMRIAAAAARLVSVWFSKWSFCSFHYDGSHLRCERHSRNIGCLYFSWRTLSHRCLSCVMFSWWCDTLGPLPVSYILAYCWVCDNRFMLVGIVQRSVKEVAASWRWSHQVISMSTQGLLTLVHFCCRQLLLVVFVIIFHIIQYIIHY